MTWAGPRDGSTRPIARLPKALTIAPKPYLDEDMAHLPVQCQNCGARYKIPDSFKSDKAKCKACGNMIDVAAARAGGEADEAPKAAAKPRAASTGGTRKPRASKRRRGEAEAPKAKAAPAENGPLTRRRRGPHGAEDHAHDEDGNRVRYEKKKDNTPMIAGIVIVAMLVVAGVFYALWEPPPENTNTASNENATKNEKAGDADKESATDPNKAGDANAKEGDTAKADAEAADAEAKKKAADKKAKAAAAKKKAEAAKKAAEAAAKKEIKDPKDVFKPADHLEKLPRPDTVTEAEEKEVNELLEEGRDTSFRGAKALRQLGTKSYKILPLVANRLLTLDYAKEEDNLYAFQICKEVIQPITDWGFGIEQSRVIGEMELKTGHENALRIKNIHQHARLFWSSEENWQKYKKKYNKQ